MDADYPRATFMDGVAVCGWREMIVARVCYAVAMNIPTWANQRVAGLSNNNPIRKFRLWLFCRGWLWAELDGIVWNLRNPEPANGR